MFDFQYKATCIIRNPSKVDNIFQWELTSNSAQKNYICLILSDYKCGLMNVNDDDIFYGCNSQKPPILWLLNWAVEVPLQGQSFHSDELKLPMWAQCSLPSLLLGSPGDQLWNPADTRPPVASQIYLPAIEMSGWLAPIQKSAITKEKNHACLSIDQGVF